MDVRFATRMLERLEREDDSKCGFSKHIVELFRRRMQAIRAAVDERAFYAMKSLRYEKLSGARAGQRSMRLDRQFRLILEIVQSKPGNIVVIVSIEDYH